MHRLFAMILLPLLAANMVPRDPSILALQAMDLRVATMGHRIALDNAARCIRKLPQTGLLLHSLGQYDKASRKTMTDQFGLTAAPTVQAVVPGSAAARAGLYEGDRILAINGVATPALLEKRPSLKTVEATQNQLEAALLKGPATLTLARQNSKVQLSPNMGCLSLFIVEPSSKPRASAAGSYVQLSTAIIEAARDDDELAFIIAHEMAHNILEHKARLDVIGRKTANVKATEIEADSFGLLLMKGAGFDPDAAARFWAREGDRMDAGIFSDGTHMSVGKRVEFLRSEAIRLIS